MNCCAVNTMKVRRYLLHCLISQPSQKLSTCRYFPLPSHTASDVFAVFLESYASSCKLFYDVFINIRDSVWYFAYLISKRVCVARVESVEVLDYIIFP